MVASRHAPYRLRTLGCCKRILRSHVRVSYRFVRSKVRRRQTISSLPSTEPEVVHQNVQTQDEDITHLSIRLRHSAGIFDVHLLDRHNLEIEQEISIGVNLNGWV